MTYARARLWLGITSVGTIVVLSTLALIFDLPKNHLPTNAASPASDLRWLVVAFGVYLGISLPFDVLGGLVLPQRYGRSTGRATEFAVAWIGGILFQGVWVLALGLVVMRVARQFGEPAAVAAVVGASLILLALQSWLARRVGRIRRVPFNVEPMKANLAQMGIDSVSIEVLDNTDPGFTGGWTGFPGRERLILPRQWLEWLGPEELTSEIVRRVGVVKAGARTRGLWLALVWNTLGFALAAWWETVSLATVAGLVSTALLFTLWSFLGALVLPSLSRSAVFAADRFALDHGISPRVLYRVLKRLDTAQDDEPRRSRAIEAIFHPVPSLSRRQSQWAAGRKASPGAWHAARTALFLSWACFGLLGRAVHCNCGRPELWVLLPAD